jgi:hypothetical protein
MLYRRWIMKRHALFLMVFSVMIVCGAAYSAETYYVQSMKAKVMAASSFKAGVLGEVGKGVRLAGIGKEGNWIKVRYLDKEGYVSSLLVTPYPPMARVGLIKADGAEFKQGVRRRASTYTSAAAARGLAADDRRRLSSDEKSDYAALEWMEAFTVTDAELARFVEGGR